jgi:hypothetical protein
MKPPWSEQEVQWSFGKFDTWTGLLAYCPFEVAFSDLMKKLVCRQTSGWTWPVTIWRGDFEKTIFETWEGLAGPENSIVSIKYWEHTILLAHTDVYEVLILGIIPQLSKCSYVILWDTSSIFYFLPALKSGERGDKYFADMKNKYRWYLLSTYSIPNTSFYFYISFKP